MCLRGYVGVCMGVRVSACVYVCYDLMRKGMTKNLFEICRWTSKTRTGRSSVKRTAVSANTQCIESNGIFY